LGVEHRIDECDQACDRGGEAKVFHVNLIGGDRQSNINELKLANANLIRDGAEDFPVVSKKKM
jgi:hypothetical protein